LLLFYKPLHLEAQQVSTRIEVRRHHRPQGRVVVLVEEDQRHTCSAFEGLHTYGV
jgi:hypothetical protein